MAGYLESKRQDLKRQRRERYIIILLGLLISILTYLGIRLMGWGLNLPLSTNILLFALINLNIILLLLLLYLTVRNLVKLFFERRKNVMGSRLRTKLVLAFITLSLIPTIILFFISVKFISSSIEFWFNLQIDRSLKNSLEVGSAYYKQISDQLIYIGERVGHIITAKGYMLRYKRNNLMRLLHQKRIEHDLSSIQVFYKNIYLVAASYNKGFDPASITRAITKNKKMIKRVLANKKSTYLIHSFPYGDMVFGLTPIFSRVKPEKVVGVVVLTRFVPKGFVNKLDTIAKGVQEYKQLKMMKQPIKLSNMITISIVTLLIIFSSIWFGFYLSKQITVPIKELVEATNRIAAGDYDFYIDLTARDEIGYLVNSFNKMTSDLKHSKEKLEEANRELRKSNIELEQRKIYMEIVLKNVAAGVISIDAEGRIQTINRSAEEMLNLEPDEAINKDYSEVLPRDYVDIINDFLMDRSLILKGHIKKQVNLTMQDRSLSLLVSLNLLRDEKGNNMGMVAVFEDLTEIEKAHRMTAWREVARRIAHEVKNPLTPIQLSAQRLKRRLSEKLGEPENTLLKECTDMIVGQVDELKRLVNEFHKFARMPASNPVPSDIRGIIEETLGLFKEANKGVSFIFQKNGDIPILNLDRSQIKRAIINILENAVEAVNGRGRVNIDLEHDKELQIVRIKISDNGSGIPPEYKARLFEPYFSTKKHGTGLGLTIVNTIVSDHDGFIRVYDNHPRGTCFVIELPVRTQTNVAKTI